MWAPNFRDTWVNVYDSPHDVFELKDVFVDRKTGLVVKDGLVLWPMAVENIIWYKSWITVDSKWKDPISRYELIAERMRTLQEYANSLPYELAKALPDGRYLHLLHPFGRYVYGHLFDTFQKLAMVDGYSFDGVILSKSNEVVDFSDHLMAVGFDGSMVVPDSYGDLLFVPNLVFVRPLSHPTNFSKSSYEFIRNRYFNFFKGPQCDTGRKIFLIRRKGAYRRYLVNSDEVENALVSSGVEIYDGSESFRELFNAFASASRVSGVHGALFVNNIFSFESCKYLEFCPKTRPVKTFFDQYKRVVDYEHNLVDCDDAFNISLDIDRLVDFYKS